MYILHVIEAMYNSISLFLSLSIFARYQACQCQHRFSVFQADIKHALGLMGLAESGKTTTL